MIVTKNKMIMIKHFVRNLQRIKVVIGVMAINKTMVMLWKIFQRKKI